jgi:signal transduction histidine kinase
MNTINSLQRFLAPPVFSEDEEKTRIASLLNFVLWGFAAAALAMAGAVLVLFSRVPNAAIFLFSSGVLVAIGLGGQFLMRRGQTRLASVILQLVLVALITYVLCAYDGIRNPALAGYVLIIIIAGLLLGGRGAILFAVISLAMLAGVFFLTQSGFIRPTLTDPYAGDLILDTVIFGLSALMLYLAAGNINRSLEAARRNARAQLKANWALEANRVALEARTRDLALAAEIGRRLATVRDLDQLLAEAVELIRERFDLYYAQVYLIEAGGHALVLRAGTGHVGAELLRRQHRLPVGFGSINGMAAYEAHPIIVADTATSSAFKPNPLLPDTRAEMSVPLMTGERVAGILDLQSARRGALTEENLPAFEAVAGQLTIGIENARLFAETSRSRAEAEERARRLTRTGWAQFLNAVDRSERLGYTYDREKVTATAEPLPLPDASTLAAPMVITGEMIGQLQLQREAGQAWTDDEAEIVLAVARQAAQQVENLRVLAEAERYRTEAEAATRQLTREGWKTQMAELATAEVGFVYDQRQIAPLPAADEAEAGIRATLTQPLAVRGETIGEMALAGPAATDEATTRLVSVVADRLSAHLENLRLLTQTQKRAAELAAVAQVSTAVSTLLEAQKLLQTVVNLTKSAFGLYHAHIYLLNPAKDQLVLATGAGEAGKQMVAQGWSIPANRERSLVARTARERQGVIVNDVRAAPDFMPNPLLPETRSEMAVPLIVGDTLLGVFDVQADRVNHFTAEDVRIYTTLAAQVAVALQNANLYAEQAAIVVRLRELDQLKSAFLANMSHELRTPLNSVLGFTQVILEGLDGPLTTNMTADLQLIEKNGQHLLNLINDVLDMAKIEAGRVSLVLERINPRELVEDVFETAGSLAREKSLYLKVDSAVAPDLTLMADHTRLRQVIINVIGNAIKFTESGGITVHLAQQDDRLQLRICDTGIGIPANKLETVFEAFSQIDTSTTRKAGGTGLGLPISRRLVELHGGRLWAESSGVAGEGSTFFLELPLQAPAK